ncbi:hypothetical protein [Streptomyces dioscori]|uniref:hypothetical protein n=1 Tax=Streptomyces dioscori TaxID=2109333 RepID=UPI0018FE20A6|nr:hypothetical protein [Streptomyces dioscori]
MDEDEGGALTGHAVGAAVSVHHAVPQPQFAVAHGPQPRGPARAPSWDADHRIVSPLRAFVPA